MTRRKSSERPVIWAEGRQHPPFEVRAFARATLAFTREGLAGLLQRCAASAARGGAAVMAGVWRIPAHRLGRTGRFLPSHRSVGGAVLGLSGLLDETARRVRGQEDLPSTLFRTAPPATEPAPVPPMPRPRRLQAAPAPAPAATAAEPAFSRAADDPDLAAIRALLTEPPPPAVAAARPPRPPVQAAPAAAPTAAANAPAEPWRRAALRNAAATALGYGLLVVSVPYGALRATIAHLNGEDLRKLT